MGSQSYFAEEGQCFYVATRLVQTLSPATIVHALAVELKQVGYD
jgi:hypothetical protein